MSTRKASQLANTIAVRRLAVVGEPGREVVVTLGKPRPDPKPGGDWMCSYLVEGLPDARKRAAHGVDAMQALLMALEAVRVALRAAGLQLAWEGGEPGDAGIPRMVPLFYGLGFAREIERHIDAQIEERARAGGREPGAEPAPRA